MRGKSQNWVLEQQPPTAQRQFDASMSHPWHNMWACAASASAACVHRGSAHSNSVTFKGSGAGQRGPGHHWTLTKRRATRLLLPPVHTTSGCCWFVSAKGSSLCLYLDFEFQFLLDADHLLCSAHLPDTFIACFHHLWKRVETLASSGLKWGKGWWTAQKGSWQVSALL